VLPDLELRPADVDRRAIHVAEVHVALADLELALRIAHGRAAVAAAAGLMEEQRAVLRHQLAEHGRRFRGDADPGDVGHDQKNPSFFGQ
jgi:hypothetical protein